MLPATNIDVSTRPGHLVLAVAGELDFETCPGVSRVTEVLPLRGQTLTVDLSSVTFIDSSGLHLLLALRRRADREGASLELAGVPQHALRMLELAGARGLFTVIPAPHPRPGLPPVRRLP
ncbi:STAS domain-containing protein [Streptomyces sp. NPDC101118]|uniref:STAS domain-containing protein n=1 Tax=Streptomyces sp. NPDC101118 TaxID=3366109 RepID=UPI0038055193